MRKRPNAGDTVIHTRTEGRYVVGNSEAQMKMEDGHWVAAVIYSPEGAMGATYVRDLKTFMKNFSEDALPVIPQPTARK